MYVRHLNPSSFLHLSETQCSEILFGVRWPEGYRCPRCGSTRHSTIRTRRLPLYECADCRKQCSVISGTIMERSRTPLPKRLTAIALIAHGCVSAAFLCRKIDVTYKTAWLMLHKIREAMAGAVEDEPLAGFVRLAVGCANSRLIPEPFGLHPMEHPFIIGASVNESGEPERIRIAVDMGGDTHMGTITPEGAMRFIEQCVESTAVVDLYVDDWGRTDALAVKRIGWSIESNISLAHRTVGAKHLHYYLQEGAYRFNVVHAEANPWEALMRLCGSGGAPDLRAVVGRLAPTRPDWHTYRSMRRMIHRMRELAAEWMPGRSSA